MSKREWYSYFKMLIELFTYERNHGKTCSIFGWEVRRK